MGGSRSCSIACVCFGVFALARRRGRLVAVGCAPAYRKNSTDHVSYEAGAKAVRRGAVVRPGWRRTERLEAAPEVGGGDCRIKGELSAWLGEGFRETTPRSRR